MMMRKMFEKLPTLHFIALHSVYFRTDGEIFDRVFHSSCKIVQVASKFDT